MEAIGVLVLLFTFALNGLVLVGIRNERARNRRILLEYWRLRNGWRK